MKMPCCSVVICKNRSENSNFKSNGITYHRFPRDSTLKQEWISATNRGPNWWPLERSTICSAHFEDKCFKPLKNSRRLFEWAAPTLKLRLVFANAKSTKCDTKTKLSTKNSNDLYTGNIANEVLQTRGLDQTEPQNKTEEQLIIDTPRKRKIQKRLNQPSKFNVNKCESRQDLNQNELNTDDTPRKRKMRLQLHQYENMVNEKNKKIRNLQKKASRYKKKIVQLNEILKELQTKDLLNSDQASHLENVGVEDLIKRYKSNAASNQITNTKYIL